eukprot:Protomagalhaensia_wolfi_Nauph_80__5717@NODE_683_length_2124_cov_1449_759712_g510_i0_p1_GENE_NODE_683_length_2124_cov_1449_759712_g510_i0NODE_683_length_2124_cov_1449_759712_g510_i0_p1_ORF_typecomplete_len390_score63_09DUF5463/PF17551_2/0_083DUF5463/PF17551_2/8e03AbiEi_3/PF11459_8/9_3AbiEi_3/PF11459_8/71_NODE_683_length_2124_cov_1449_759712_g510_i02201389
MRFSQSNTRERSVIWRRWAGAAVVCLASPGFGGPSLEAPPSNSYTVIPIEEEEERHCVLFEHWRPDVETNFLERVIRWLKPRSLESFYCGSPEYKKPPLHIICDRNLVVFVSEESDSHSWFNHLWKEGIDVGTPDSSTGRVRRVVLLVPDTVYQELKCTQNITEAFQVITRHAARSDQASTVAGLHMNRTARVMAYECQIEEVGDFESPQNSLDLSNYLRLLIPPEFQPQVLNLYQGLDEESRGYFEVALYHGWNAMVSTVNGQLCLFVGSNTPCHQQRVLNLTPESQLWQVNPRVVEALLTEQREGQNKKLRRLIRRVSQHTAAGGGDVSELISRILFPTESDYRYQAYECMRGMHPVPMAPLFGHAITLLPPSSFNVHHDDDDEDED